MVVGPERCLILRAAAAAAAAVGSLLDREFRCLSPLAGFNVVVVLIVVVAAAATVFAIHYVAPSLFNQELIDVVILHPVIRCGIRTGYAFLLRRSRNSR